MNWNIPIKVNGVDLAEEDTGIQEVRKRMNKKNTREFQDRIWERDEMKLPDIGGGSKKLREDESY
jgi:hypothetical protein